MRAESSPGLRAYDAGELAAKRDWIVAALSIDPHNAGTPPDPRAIDCPF